MPQTQPPLDQLFADARAYAEAQQAEADRLYRAEVAQQKREHAILRAVILSDILQDEPRLEALSDYIALDDIGGTWKTLSLCLPDCDRIVMTVVRNGDPERWSLYQYNIYFADAEDWWECKVNYAPVKDFLGVIDTARQSYTGRKAKEAQQAEREASAASDAAGYVARAAKKLDFLETFVKDSGGFATEFDRTMFEAVELLWDAYDGLSQAVGNGAA